jgi:hypothetical protein
MGYVYSKPNFRHIKPVLAHDGPSAPTDAARSRNDPASNDQPLGHDSDIFNVEWCLTTSSQHILTTRAVT